MNANDLVDRIIMEQNKSEIIERPKKKVNILATKLHDNVNQFFIPVSGNYDLSYACFGYQEYILDNESFFRLYISVVDSKYRINNNIFKFSRSNLRRLNGNGISEVFNTVEFKISHDDMVFDNCPLKYFQEYFEKVIENIKNNENFYKIDYDNIF